VPIKEATKEIDIYTVTNQLTLKFNPLD